MSWKVRFKTFFSLKDDINNVVDSIGKIFNGLIGFFFYTIRILGYGLRKYKSYVDKKKTGKKFEDKGMKIFDK